jgi:hypothetical protein
MATINHKTYNEATETFKDFSVYDGKETLIFKVDGSEGNVGIGTSSPTDTIGYGRALDIQSSTGAVVYLRDSNAPTTQYGFLAFDGSDNGLKLHNANSSGFLRFDTNATERMRITAAGNVGIGTTSPATKLDVAFPSDGTAGAVFGYTGGTNNPRIFFNVNESTSKGQIIMSGSSGALDLGIGAGGTEIITLKGTGNVGIGTSSPDTKLQVAGTGATGLSIRSNTSGDAFMRYYLDTVIASDAYVDRSTGNLNIRTNQNSSAIVFSTSAALIERVRITDNGLTFNGDTAAANALDDYEEGTWTPTTTTAGYTISSSSGKYTKIGRQVTIQGKVNFSAVNGSSNSAVGLNANPFSASDLFTGLCREDTVTGASYVASLQNVANTIEINSMDGVATASQRPIAIGETYVFTITYFV